MMNKHGGKEEVTLSKTVTLIVEKERSVRFLGHKERSSEEIVNSQYICLRDLLSPSV